MSDHAVTAPRRSPGLSAATVRAYAADIRALSDWCSSRGLSPDLRELDARRVFVHCVDMIESGRSASTVRRRLTALRSAAAAGQHVGVTARDLRELEHRAIRGASSRESVLVLSDDPITRMGLSAALTESGALCWADPLAAVDEPTLTAWSYVLVWIGVPDGIDRFGAVPQFDRVAPAVTNAVPVVAVHAGQLHPMVRLRLSEAGFRYAVSHEWLGKNLGRLFELLVGAELPAEFHLETPLALRQSLGLLLAGRLAPLLRAAAALPAEVWTSDSAQDRLPISRHEVRRLRQLALDDAGVPAPAFARYSTALRRAPETPEWGVLRDVVRASFDLSPVRGT